ncbi:MAG: multidrug efflux RND transporter permease subunit [Chlamydiia bacterium]|nr:multidrug efflux RND transporter permease subunit [Chlamydiia bacterium]
MPRFFINRPIFAIVVSLVIIIAGLVAMVNLPIEQYPTITPVQIQVTTTYPGASATTVGQSVAAPIEAQINGVENMLYMKSTSSNTGQLSINVFFSLDTDPDIAQVLVQNRVNLAMPQLPDAVKQFGVSVQKQSPNVLMVITAFDKSGRYTADYLNTWANVYLLDAIKRVNGAGQSQIFGMPDQAMRIWLNPDRMTSLGITTTDVKNAIASQNALIGAGQIGAQPSVPDQQLTLPVITQLPFTKPEEYENIILRTNQDGSAIVHVSDVARAEVGKRQYIGTNFFNAIPTAALAVYQQAGANGLDVSRGVRQVLKDMKASMPEGIEMLVALDTTDFVKISIKEVIETLVIAAILVILVVYLFLQSLRPTFICVTAIVVALVGTFIGMFALGFSINLLTLFAMVLAIGIVVDDAIVVVENVERNMESGKISLKEATIKAMEEVTGPVIATTFVMAAVFVPAAFLPGTTGQLYKQFAITIVVSVSISSIVALSLTPALCAKILKPGVTKHTGFFAWFNRVFDKLIDSYGKGIGHIIGRKLLFLGALALLCLTIIPLFNALPTSFVPNEDQGYVFAQVMMPNGSSLNRTEATSQEIEKLFQENPAVESTTVVNGYSLIDSQYLTNMATLFVTLRDFEERYKNVETAKKENAKAVLESVFAKSKDVLTGFTLPIAPPAIPGIGTTGGFEFWIQDKGTGNAEELSAIVEKFLEKVKERSDLAQVRTTFQANTEQLKVDVNRPLALLLGVPVESVYDTLQAQFGSLQASQYEQYSRIWNVILQSDAPFRQSPNDINRLYTRSKDGKMVPIAGLATVHSERGPDLLPHFNGFPAAQITGNPAPGYSSGQAIQAMEEVAREVLPSGYSYAWAGMAFQEVTSGGSSAAAFIFGIIIVFLILAAQYESWSLPGAVLTAVPFGILGALIFTWLRGLDNDVYFQIGLLLLVGLAAKNAILIVEFAVELKAKGRTFIDAAIEAGKLRLRPITMTSLSFIFGVFPLVIAMGAGANARHSIGTGTVGGMIGVSTLALLYVPLFFVLFEKLGGGKDEE